MNEFVVVFPPWGPAGHFVRLPFHLELLQLAQAQGSQSRAVASQHENEQAGCGGLVTLSFPDSW